jgi:hypothetical protein
MSLPITQHAHSTLAEGWPSAVLREGGFHQRTLLLEMDACRAD